MFNSVHSKALPKREAFAKDPENAKTARKIGHATWTWTDANGDRVTRYQRTDVAWWSADGSSVVLRSSGWRGPTTAARIHDALRGSSFRLAVGWILKDVDGSRRVPFFEGIRLPDALEELPETRERWIREAEAHSRKIRDFCRAIPEDAPAPLPAMGDCLLCVAASQHPDFRAGCELSHLEENYLHGSLLLRAMRWDGWTETAIRLAFSRGGYFRTRNTLRRFMRMHALWHPANTGREPGEG